MKPAGLLTDFECVAPSAGWVERAARSLGLTVVSVVPRSSTFVAQWQVDAASGKLFTFVRLDRTPRVWVARGHLSRWEEVRDRAAARAAKR